MKRTQPAPARQQQNQRLRALDAKTLDRDISARNWGLDEADYIARILDGQTLNAGLRRTANSY